MQTKMETSKQISKQTKPWNIILINTAEESSKSKCDSKENWALRFKKLLLFLGQIEVVYCNIYKKCCGLILVYEWSLLEFIFWQYDLQEMNFVIILLLIYLCISVKYCMVFQLVIKTSSGLKSGTYISGHKHFVCVHKSLVFTVKLGWGVLIFIYWCATNC